MIDQKYYICQYCFEEFTPKRRYVQKFCSNSCRSKAHHIKNRSSESPTAVSATVSAALPAPIPITIPEKKKKKKKKKESKPEQITLPGISAAAIGTFATNALTNALTREENKPATKGDLKALGNKIGRYHKVVNIPHSLEGKPPYYDMETKTIVYLNF
jgi:hypothetical protein